MITTKFLAVLAVKGKNQKPQTAERRWRGLWWQVVGGLLISASPCLAAPVIFNSTETAAPGEVIYLQGDNFSSSPQVWFHRVLTTDTSLTPDTQLTPVSTSSTQAVTASLPQNEPLGLYAVWVKDSSGNLSAPVFINRARATSFEYPQIAAYSASNPSGSYTFRIFGRNLMINGSTPSVTFVNGSNSYAATVVTSYPNDGNVLQVQAPAGISAGTTYSVTVSNGSGHSSANYDVTTALQTIQGRTGGADPFNLGVPWASDFVPIAADVVNVVTSTNPHTNAPYGADPTGSANSVNAIQQALYDAGNPTYHPNGATVSLPAGTYLVNFTGENLQFYGPSGTTINQNAPNTSAHFELNIPAHVVLEGAGVGSTIINDSSPAYDGYSYFVTIADATPNSGSLSGVQGFTYNQNMTVSENNSPPSIRNYAANSSEIFFDHIQVAFAHGVFNTTDVIYGSFVPQCTNDTNVLVQDCTMSYLRFGNNNYYGYGYSYGSNYIFRDNTFTSFFARLEFDYMGNLLIEGNHFTRDGDFPPPNYGGSTTCGGIESTGADKTILGNTLDAINLPLSSYNDGESILCQAGPVYGGTSTPTESGTASSATANTLTDSAKTWDTNAYAGLTVTITGGTGNGESATITSNTSTVLTVSTNWKTVPTSTSTFAISQANPSVPDSGTVSSATTHGMTDTTKSWSANAYNGLILAITGGTGQGEWAEIAGTTANTLSLDRDWVTLPTSTSTYSIQQADSYVLGTLTGAGSTTLTDTTQNWPTNFHAGDSVAIISGSGAGQIATIVSNTSTTLTITPALSEYLSLVGSHYAINGALSYGAQRWIVKDNTLDQVDRGIIFYLGAYDCAVVGNSLASAGGIFLTGWQRSFLGTNVPYNRFDIGWKNVITDNVVSDPDQERAPYVAVHASYTTTSPLDGTIILGTETRRNLLQSSEVMPDPWDGAFGSDESFTNIVTQSTSGNVASGIGIMDSVYTDNVSVDSDIAYEVTTAASQTPIWDSLQLNCGDTDELTASNNLLLKDGDTVSSTNNTVFGDFTVPGADDASSQTAVGETSSGRVFDANFTGTGTSTGLGGTGANLIDVGASGSLAQGTGQTASILSTPPFDSGSGSYMHIAWLGNGGRSGAGLQSTAINPRYSWARIFDQRSGQWLVNGGFDFFLRPGQTYPDNSSGGQYMRAIDMGSPGTNSLRIVFYYSGSNEITLQIISPSGGGGNNGIYGVYSAGFTAGSVYHLGVTFSTDASKSPPLTTAKIFVAPGTGAINTASTANLIATGTFALNSSVVNDMSPTSWFNGGTWNFGGGYGPTGVAVNNDFDGFKLYYIDPGTFPALDSF